MQPTNHRCMRGVSDCVCRLFIEESLRFMDSYNKTSISRSTLGALALSSALLPSGAFSSMMDP